MKTYQQYKLNKIAAQYEGLAKEAGLEKEAFLGALYYVGRALPTITRMLRYSTKAKHLNLIKPLANIKGTILKKLTDSGKYGKAFVQGVHNAQYANRVNRYTDEVTRRALNPNGFVQKVKGTVSGAGKAAKGAPKVHKLHNVKANPYTLGDKANFGERMAYNVGRYINPNHYGVHGRIFMDTMMPLPFIGGSILSAGSKMDTGGDIPYNVAYDNSAAYNAYLNGQYYGDYNNYNRYY